MAVETRCGVVVRLRSKGPVGGCLLGVLGREFELAGGRVEIDGFFVQLLLTNKLN